MIGVAGNTLTDFDIQLVVDADMRTWVDKLPHLCDRVDLATLNMTLNMKEGTLEHMREVRSFKVRAIEKYARIHASNGLIYLDNDVHIQPRAQADFLAVFQAMRSARASVALRRAKCCIPKGHEIAGIPNTFCERQGGTMILHRRPSPRGRRRGPAYSFCSGRGSPRAARSLPCRRRRPSASAGPARARRMRAA